MLADVLGLTRDEAAIYRSLIAVPSTTAPELAERIGVAALVALKVLGDLEQKGLAAQSLSDTADADDLVFVATPPSQAIGALLVQRHNELKTAELELGELDAIYRAARLGRGAFDVVDVVHGPEAIRERFNALQVSATEEVLSFVKAPASVVSSASNSPAEDSALGRGVRYRVILERAMLDEETGLFDAIIEGQRQGQEVRVANSLPLKLVIVDREYGFLPLIGSDPASTGALLVHRSGLLDALLALFETEWDRAVPMMTDADQGRKHLGPEVDDLDVRIISLLLAGYADHAVASQTETSMRTVQRRVQLLMQRTGAETRMQLGYRAARLGWI